MTTHHKAQTRPGHPDGPGWWHPIAVTAALVVVLAGLVVLWAAPDGTVFWIVFFAFQFLVIGLLILASVAVVVAVPWLALKRGWRPKLAAFVLMDALFAFVLWVVQR